MASTTPQELKLAYRHLYKGVLHAVQYAKPQRFVARDRLRNAFKKEDPSTFNRERIDKTIEFLRLAAKENGLEHKILKNLLHTEFQRHLAHLEDLRKNRNPAQRQVREGSRLHYDMTLAMLNSTMGLCLR